MILTVTFPHADEQGNRYQSGDLREVPDDQVEYFTAPSILYGMPILAYDSSMDQEKARASLPQFEPVVVSEEDEAVRERLEAMAAAELAEQRELLENARKAAEAGAAAEAEANAKRQAEAEAQAKGELSEAEKAEKTTTKKNK